MTTFTDSVRKGEVKGPQQGGFRIDAWDAAFNSMGKGNIEDAELHFAGTWFNQEFAKVRSNTEEALNSFKWSTSRDRVCAFVGYAVLQWSIIIAAIRKQMNEMQDRSVFISELEKVRVKSPFFKVVNPAGTIENLVDGLRFPLSLPHERRPPTISFGAGGLMELGAFTTLAFTGQHYHILEERWLDCVWNNFRVISCPEITRLEPRDLELAKRKAISGFRRDSLFNEATYYANSFWKHRLSDQARQAHLSKLKVLSVYKRGTRFRVKAVPATRFPDRGRTLDFFRLALTPEHTDSLLDVSFPALNGLTVVQVMHAYDLLSQIPDQIANFLPMDRGIKRPEELTRWAPIFSRSELIGSLRGAMGIHSAAAEWLVNQMTFSCSVRDALWFRPFVPIGEEDLAFVAPAVHGVNFARLLDWILRSTPEAEVDLGPRFEKFIHEKLSEAARKSRLAAIARVSNKAGIFLRTPSTEEEIDLAFMLGNQLFICELKANRFPCEPLQHQNYRLKLDEATEQVIRKVNFVRGNLDLFLAEAGIVSCIPSASIVVRPLVVSSSPLFAGWEWRGVPVCDWYILSRFFSEGNLGFLGQSAESGELQPALTWKFYDSPEEAEKAVFQYFCHAPQVQMFEPFVENEDSPLPIFEFGETPKVFVISSVRLPHDALREIANNLHKAG